MNAEIERLSVAERLQLAEELWASIADSPESLPLTQVQRDELDSQLETLRQQPGEGFTWPELKVRLTNR